MTFWEFAQWQEGKRLSDELNWTKVGTFMALFANANRDPKKSKAFEMGDFNPYHYSRKKEAPELTEVDFSKLESWGKKKVDG